MANATTSPAQSAIAPPRLLILGAHPDDAEFQSGGLAALYRRCGFPVRMVSVTNGQSGHQSMPSKELVALRRVEAARSAALIGAESSVWDFPDGELLPTLELRRAIIAELRSFAPDLVLTHRTCDYHPDHRAVGQAVQDACYMVTVPKIVPEVPALRRDPVVAHMPDLFTRPAPLRPDVIVDITGILPTVIAMLACHASQFFDWLPYNLGIADSVPQAEAERTAWLAEWYRAVIRPRSDRCRQNSTAPLSDMVEMYEVSEHARPLGAADRARLFPFLLEA
jgi:LmbE family N-acetylglucosaminyl deacetylase